LIVGASLKAIAVLVRNIRNEISTPDAENASGRKMEIDTPLALINALYLLLIFGVSIFIYNNLFIANPVSNTVFLFLNFAIAYRIPYIYAVIRLRKNMDPGSIMLLLVFSVMSVVMSIVSWVPIFHAGNTVFANSWLLFSMIDWSIEIYIAFIAWRLRGHFLSKKDASEQLVLIGICSLVYLGALHYGYPFVYRLYYLSK